MAPYGPLKGAVFVYDLLRLFALFSFFSFSARSLEIPGQLLAPMVMASSPNALFPLMSLFMALRGGVQRLYGPLYSSGKVIAMAATAGWLIFSLRMIRQAVSVENGRPLILLGAGLALIVLDGISVICVNIPHLRLEKPPEEALEEREAGNSDSGI